MNNNRQARKDYLFIIVFIYTLIFSSMTMINGFTNIVDGQTNVTQTNSSNTTNLVNTQDIPLDKVRVGDIEMAYKMFGKGDPLILHNGASDHMDAWDPALLSRLASNNTVIIFDSRGIGNTTAGTEPYSIQLLGNDTAGLMDALKIQNANVLGYSLGTFTTQQFAITHPDMVSSVILIAGTCGGKDGIPKPTEFMKSMSEMANKSSNNESMTQEDFKSLVTASLGSGWVKLHPESADIPENMTLAAAKPGLSPEAVNNQMNAGFAWEATNWNGVCDDLAKIDKPLLTITGTDDNEYVPHENSLVIANKVPGAWVVQIKDAGHAVPDQYPEEVGNIIETFLSTVK
ncbi:alpha/beta fold hydrolase [Candidatus Nitrosocosmicus sp. R]